MTVSIRRDGAALLAAAAFLLATIAVPTGGAAAQGTNAPTAEPWDDRVKRFYGRSHQPDRDLDRARQRLYGDPLHDKMGMPENRLEDPQGRGDAPSVAPPAFDQQTQRLDGDRDGGITREEYFQGHARNVTPGFRGERRHDRAQQRLDFQFRKADRNGDGRVTADELRAGQRF